VVGLLVASNEPYSMFPPNITCMVNRDVIGIVSKIDDEDGRCDLAELWLKNSGCSHIFFVDSVTGEGVDKIIEYLERH
jgi:ethanolamine utilization protein EutP